MTDIEDLPKHRPRKSFKLNIIREDGYINTIYYGDFALNEKIKKRNTRNSIIG